MTVQGHVLAVFSKWEKNQRKPHDSINIWQTQKKKLKGFVNIHEIMRDENYANYWIFICQFLIIIVISSRS